MTKIGRLRAFSWVGLLGAVLGQSGTVRASDSPDLAVTDVTLSTAYLKKNETLTVKAKVTNSGTGDFTGTAAISFRYCQSGPDNMQMAPPDCTYLNAATGQTPTLQIGALKAAETVEVSGAFVVGGYTKPAHIAVGVTTSSGDTANDWKKVAIELERPPGVPLGDLELKDARGSRDSDGSHVAKLTLKLLANDTSKVKVIAKFCRQGTCEEKLNQEITPAWKPLNKWSYAEHVLQFELDPYHLPTQFSGDLEVDVQKVGKRDADWTNNHLVVPAPVKPCPKKKVKHKKKGKKSVLTCTAN